MLQSYLNGLAVAAGLIVAIGAQNAFVLSCGLRREHPVLVAAICVLCDVVLIVAGVFGLSAPLLRSPLLLAAARWGGAAFLVGYGLRALHRAWRPAALRGEARGAASRRTVVLSTLAVTLLNPHVYIDTVLLLGSLGARQALPAAYAAGAASASTLWFFGLAAGAARMAPWLARPAVWRGLDLGVAAIMFAVAWGLARG